MKKLQDLLSNISEVTLRGPIGVDITGVVANSKTVAPGNLFVAKRGEQHDGGQYIGEAIAAGAAAILTDLFDPFLPPHIAQLLTDDVKGVEVKLAARYYDFPSQHLFLTGITGTNGKTTTGFIIRHLLSREEHPCGLLGTIEWDLGRNLQPALYTTPDVATTQRLLCEMRHAGCLTAAMEVSSHALDQGRVEGCIFGAAVFTNLTHEHLDYHKTMEKYAEAKGKLFRMLPKEATAVLNCDSNGFEVMRDACGCPLLTYGIDRASDLRPEKITYGADSTRFTLLGKSVCLPLLGKHNVYNAVAAIGVALTYGMQWDEIQEKLETLPVIPGRLEGIPNNRGVSIFIDYAHTEDALIQALSALRQIVPNRLFVLLGCGGNRDRQKRGKMGGVATTLADFAIFTTDNPRHEPPQQILGEIVAGCLDSGRYVVEEDRARAIKRAIELLTPGDCLLVAGKGHERHQIIGSTAYPFSDRKVITMCLEESV